MNRPKIGTKKPRKSRFEFSAGGVVQDGANLLMVLVENLEGRRIWTFPKGHIEKGEKAPQAALREVEEETGYRCEIVRPFERAQYYYQRDGALTKKTVTWFLMRPLEKTGVHDPEEILDTEWVTMEEAWKRAKYKSDRRIMGKLSRTL